ncbi:DUF3768 domain-containing protein [Bosea sp. PAMC 26642]|uniref:DUF3768 domain-containing protein n=1 Tax=Bosea sp. (strain PAMC 26642) TaxID=1792307 RepID=UPI0007700B53|nr:DUF3768 domain-containing protein [Bosea sp. PAMC 26642]AMJ61509.1 hypothetical protein AXW83_15440 [Bosea sp. PAMC 26642]
MNDTPPSPEASTATVRALNDAFRQTFLGGTVVMTAAVTALGRASQAEIISQVRCYGEFNEANDPFGEHDFGAFTLAGEKLFFKIDYYNRDMTAGSENPADPRVTSRVLTIMCASDW